jgi:hypothetical protein
MAMSAADEDDNDNNKNESSEMYFLKRQNALLGIITSDVVPDAKTRAAKIDYLARRSIPISEVEDVYSRCKNVLRRMAKKVNRYSAKVNYDNNNNYYDDETGQGLTQLGKRIGNN